MKIVTRNNEPDSSEEFVEVKSAIITGGGNGYRGRGKGGCSKRLTGVVLTNYLGEQLQVNKGGRIVGIYLDENESLSSIKFASTEEDENGKNMTRKKYTNILRLEFHLQFTVLVNEKGKRYIVDLERYRVSSVYAEKSS